MDRMKTTRAPLASSLVAIALLATPAAAIAAEEAVVPPGNSAAAQYTEAFPTSGGDKKTDQAPHHRSPIKVLGSQNAKKLESQGSEGKAAAEAAAATAPTSVAPPPPASKPPTQGNGGGGSNAGDGAGHGNNSSGDGGAASQKTSDTASAARAVHPSTPAGSSGLGAAVGQATGLTSDGSGPLLPLVILATVFWSLAYLWRQRRQVD